MPHTDIESPSAKRVALFRKKANRRGLRRLEVAVPAADAPLLRDAAATLREGGKQAEILRHKLRLHAHGKREKTGKDLVAFFRHSPLVGLELNFERDRSTTSRPVDLG